MNATQIEQKLRDFFRANAPEVVAAYLFGSAGRGAARPGDVDVGVLLETDPPRTLAAIPSALIDGIERALGRGAPRLDLVVLNRASPDLVHHVLKDGILVCERDRAARVRFEVKMRNEYFDVKPFLDRYRRIERRR